MAIQTNHHWPQKVHRRSARVSFILLHLVAKHVWRSRQLVWRCCTHCCKMAFREERRREACDQWQTHALAACANAAPPRAGARRVATKCNPSPPPASLSSALPRARRRHERTLCLGHFTPPGPTDRVPTGPHATWFAFTRRRGRIGAPSGGVRSERRARASVGSAYGNPIFVSIALRRRPTRGRGEAELPSSSLQPFFSRPPVRS